MGMSANGRRTGFQTSEREFDYSAVPTKVRVRTKDGDNARLLTNRIAAGSTTATDHQYSGVAKGQCALAVNRLCAPGSNPGPELVRRRSLRQHAAGLISRVVSRSEHELGVRLCTGPGIMHFCTDGCELHVGTSRAEVLRPVCKLRGSNPRPGHTCQVPPPPSPYHKSERT